MKKLFFAVPIIALLATGCNSSQQVYNQHVVQTPIAQNTTPTDTSTSTVAPKIDATQNWLSYTSHRLGLSFKYPAAWGKPIESYRNATTDSNCTPSDSPGCWAGQTDSISFSNDNKAGLTKYPNVYSASQDFQPYEGSSGFIGKTSVDQYYQNDNSPHKTVATKITLGSQPAITYITADSGGMDTFFGIQTISQINSKPFYALTVMENLNPYNADATDQQEQNFIQQVQNKTLDSSTQTRIDEYNLFLSTFVFTK